MDHRDNVLAASIDNQRVFLLECLLEREEQVIFAHTIDKAAIDYAAFNVGVVVANPEGKVLELFEYASY